MPMVSFISPSGSHVSFRTEQSLHAALGVTWTPTYSSCRVTLSEIFISLAGTQGLVAVDSGSQTRGFFDWPVSTALHREGFSTPFLPHFSLERALVTRSRTPLFCGRTSRCKLFAPSGVHCVQAFFSASMDLLCVFQAIPLRVHMILPPQSQILLSVVSRSCIIPLPPRDILFTHGDRLATDCLCFQEM